VQLAICFEVSINDRPVMLAGAADISVLSAIVTYTPRTDDGIDFDVSGLHETPDGGDHLSWLRQTLGVGDSLTIRVVESTSPADPVERKSRSNLFALEKEREYYEHLKRKYEPGPP
jgi:hypothetical protein